MQTMVLIIVFITGMLTLAGAVLGWEGMYRSRRAKAIVSSFGVTGARIIYAIVGILIAGGALMGLLGFFG